ncbi:class I SAM-dependent methyltransferase [Pararhizobium sp. DWP1-1-3]|uniref:class I SAM-dependent methyltransferase n=1 Tax=Pararhizobium sp. DWP1-1-3 TaxID=2804652 RepID=UPI003CEDF6CA
MTFTAHNVLLNDGSRTIPEKAGLLEDTPMFQGVIRTMRNTFGHNLTGLSIADLGCLEGGYTAGFARRGMIAKGIEVRQSNIDNCETVRQGLGLQNLSFSKDDVQNLEKYGAFDVIFCSGLLYHLDRPKAFIEIMARCATKMLILHTHHATHERGIRDGLSDVETHEGMLGRWFVEHDESEDDGREQHKWASWQNHRSFWPMKGGLIDLVRANGFPLVYEQLDWRPESFEHLLAENGAYRIDQRLMIVGVRI